MANSFALHSQRVLLPSGIAESWVTVSNGIVQAVEAFTPEGIEVIELGDLVVMPGLIDSHVHINEPGRTEWEGFQTATRAAAAGGITTLVDMPLNSSPVTTTVEALKTKLTSASGKLAVNCGFYGGIVPGNSAELCSLADSGVLGIKAFLSHSGIDEFPNVLESDLQTGMPIIASKGLPLLVHCELVSDHPELKAMDNAPRSHQAWLRSRPPHWENEAIALMIRLCREFQCRTHIVHLSSAEAIPMLGEAIAEGLPLTVETCPHYLVFAADDIEDGATIFKCAPPIRGRENNDLLWEALRSGLISMVVTDHSPATPSLKGLDDGRFLEAWGGIASLQFSLPATWTEARKRGFKLEQVCDWMSGNVAHFLGLEKSKGKIEQGYDADLLVFDPDGHCPTGKSDIIHRHAISPYIDKKLFGRVCRTYVDGKLVYHDGKFPNLDAGRIILRDRRS